MDRLAFRENEGQGGEQIVFVHGAAMSGWMWHDQMESLPEYHRLAPDLPGHGSSAHTRPFSLEKTSEAIAELIRSNAPSRRASLCRIGRQGRLRWSCQGAPRIGGTALPQWTHPKIKLSDADPS